MVNFRYHMHSAALLPPPPSPPPRPRARARACWSLAGPQLPECFAVADVERLIGCCPGLTDLTLPVDGVADLTALTALTGTAGGSIIMMACTGIA